MNLMLRNRRPELDQSDEGPFDDLDRLQRQLGRFFDFGFDNAGLFDRSLAPAMDLVEEDQDYVLYFDLPGVDKKDLELTVENNVLTVKGDKKEPKEGGRFFRKETWAGTFRRTVSLPPAADPEVVRAELVDGVLTVTIGKREELKPRQIAVNVR
jgi:HSP20 family protein